MLHSHSFKKKCFYVRPKITVDILGCDMLIVCVITDRVRSRRHSWTSLWYEDISQFNASMVNNKNKHYKLVF